MRTWLLQGRFTAEGLGKIADEGGSAVRTQHEAVAKAVGGSVEAFYFTVGGPYHVTAIVKVPDGVAAWGGYLTVNRQDVVSTDATELVECSVVDEGAKLSRKIAGTA